MGKIFIFFIIIAFFQNSTQAQRFRAGLSGGLVVTDVAGVSNGRDFQKLGYTFGGIVNSMLNEKNVLQFEINYITKGSQQRPDSANNGYYKLAFDYIEVPLIWKRRLNFTLFKKPVSRFDFEAGLSAGRLIRYSFISDNYTQSIDPNNFNKTDVSILLGLDYNFSSNFYFCLRYSNSVIPVTKRNTVTSPVFIPRTFNQGNNLVFQFALKIIFGSERNNVEPKTQ